MAETDLNLPMQIPGNESSSGSLSQLASPDVLNNVSLWAPTTFNGENMRFLFTWGDVQFVVQPFNVHETDHETGTDWAQKEVVGSGIFREYVGELDEQIFLRGRVFPYRLGGFSELQRFDDYRRAGNSHPLIRGDGYKLGWFVCEKLVRAHTFLSGQGIGQQIAFEAVMVRVPMPEPAEYVTIVWKGSP